MQGIILMLGISFLILISYYISGNDLLSPSVILEVCYLVSVAVMLMSWEVKYNWNTVGIILLGLVSFQFTEALFYMQRSKNRKQKMAVIDVSKAVLFLVIIIQIIVVILYAREIMRIGRAGLLESMKIVRRQNMYSASLETSQYIKFYISRIMKFNYAAAYVNLYIFLNNSMLTGKIRGNEIYLFSIIIYIMQAFLSGGRQQFLRISLAAIIIVLLNDRRRSDWKSKISIKIMVKLMLFLIIIIIAFYSIRVIIGRTSQVNDTLWDMFSVYFSGGLLGFNTYMENPIRNTGNLIGSQTFKDLFNLLYKFDFFSTRIIPQLEFRKVGNQLTNTYTAFRYYYQDFGIQGIVIMQVIFSFIFNEVYLRIKKHGDSRMIPIYSFLFFALVMHVILDQFFSILSIGFIETIIEIFILYWIESHIAVRIRTRKIPTMRME
ncbi:MAG: oligosaccharide repeat unit polymerase [Lachnospiraceae bacterium]|nr:oligosaccharide repeat unit polymerase [Lachnospiraceae bacterium]